MPPTQATNTDRPLTQSRFENYLVVAADMSTYNGHDHSIEGYQLVVTNAASTEDALELASAALDSQGGCLPLAAHTAAELRQLVEDLSRHEIEPGRAYNLSTGMSDAEVAAEEDESAADEDSGAKENSALKPDDALRAGRPESLPADPEAF